MDGVMKRLVQASALAVVVIGIATVAAQSPAADVTFRGLIDAKNIGEYMQRLSARPHHVGSPYDKDNAEWILAQFKEWGWDAQHRALRRAVPDAEGARRRAGRADDVHGDARGAGRRRSIRRRARRPSSCRPTTPIRSTATSPAPLVYVNYGRPEDYEELDRARHLGAGRDRHRALRRSRGAASSRRSPPSTARSAA